VPPSALGEDVVDCGNESESITIVADLDLRVPDLAAGCLHAHPLGRSERCLVEVDRGGRVVENEVRRDRAVSIGNGIGLRHEPPSVVWATVREPTCPFSESENRRQRLLTGHSPNGSFTGAL
jgi:hypothetical protein